MDKVQDAMDTALESKFGIEVKTTDTDGFRRSFYKLRREARDIGDASYDILTCNTSPDSPRGAVWVTKKGAGNDK